MSEEACDSHSSGAHEIDDELVESDELAVVMLSYSSHGNDVGPDPDPGDDPSYDVLFSSKIVVLVLES